MVWTIWPGPMTGPIRPNWSPVENAMSTMQPRPGNLRAVGWGVLHRSPYGPIWAHMGPYGPIWTTGGRRQDWFRMFWDFCVGPEFGNHAKMALLEFVKVVLGFLDAKSCRIIMELCFKVIFRFARGQIQQNVQSWSRLDLQVPTAVKKYFLRGYSVPWGRLSRL